MVILTWDKRHCKQLLDPLGGDDGVRRPPGLVVHLVLITSSPDPVDVLVHPVWLEGGDDGPGVILIGVTFSLFDCPVVGDVLHEVGVLFGFDPHRLVRELGPRRMLDLDDVGQVEELLLAGEHLLEKCEGTVAHSWDTRSLQDRR